jgi:SulP family sulfate permease
LASFALSLPQDRGPPLPRSLDIFDPERQPENAITDDESPCTADVDPPESTATGSFTLARAIRSSSGSSGSRGGSHRTGTDEDDASTTKASDGPETPTERTSLLANPRVKYGSSYGAAAGDVEGQRFESKRPPGVFAAAASNVTGCFRVLLNPKCWNRRAVWHEGVVYPVSLLPSVFLGLLLNVLDALSYGMILFPLGEPMFANLGSDGISMFYVSTIIAQVVFSCGGSIFKGGIGSEMIEVVPFFHQMAFTVLHRVGTDNPRSVLATCVLSFSVSSVLTGLVFFLLGTCRLGSLIGFFPRHILIGCIGGVGFFLLKTGVEVSARLSTFEYNLPTLERLFSLDTLFLWTIPLLLAVGLLVLKRFVHSNILVGAYFIGVAVIFYIVKFGARISMDALRNSGWVFDAPSSTEPWYHFYTLYGKCFSPDLQAVYSLSRLFCRRLVCVCGHHSRDVCAYLLRRASRPHQRPGFGDLHRGG